MRTARSPPWPSFSGDYSHNVRSLSPPHRSPLPRGGGEGAQDSLDELFGRASLLVPLLKERAARAEQLRHIPPESVHDLQTAGLIRIGNPERYGGHHGIELDA